MGKIVSIIIVSIFCLFNSLIAQNNTKIQNDSILKNRNTIYIYPLQPIVYKLIYPDKQSVDFLVPDFGISYERFYSTRKSLIYTASIYLSDSYDYNMNIFHYHNRKSLGFSIKVGNKTYINKTVYVEPLLMYKYAEMKNQRGFLTESGLSEFYNLYQNKNVVAFELLFGKDNKLKRKFVIGYYGGIGLRYYSLYRTMLQDKLEQINSMYIWKTYYVKSPLSGVVFSIHFNAYIGFGY